MTRQLILRSDLQSCLDLFLRNAVACLVEIGQSLEHLGPFRRDQNCDGIAVRLDVDPFVPELHWT